MEEIGGLFQTETDTEVILQMMAREKDSDPVEIARHVLSTQTRARYG